MPIRAELRKFYGERWRKVIRPRILRRAGGVVKRGKYLGGARCEDCGALDRSEVAYHPAYPKHYFARRLQALLLRPDLEWECRLRDGGALDDRWEPADLKEAQPRTWVMQLARDRRGEWLLTLPLIVKVQIGVCHLNHRSGDDRQKNLKALCRRCHLAYDEWHHHGSRADKKDAARPLLAALANQRRRRAA